MRLFVAVEIEDPTTLTNIIKFRDSVLACSDSRGFKGVEDENIHITIRFIGEVPDPYVKDVSKCLERAASIPRFSIRVKGVGAFPSLSRPRVIWVGISEGANFLKKLRDMLEPCLRSYAKPDHAEFRPHITVARVKGRFDRACLAEVMRTYEDFEFGLFTVTKVVLKRSILRPQGPLYIDVESVDLK